MTPADVHDSKAAPALLETFIDQPGPAAEAGVGRHHPSSLPPKHLPYT
ncbi:hypothetical protein [Streptomyces cellulosae]|uniref:Transposase n=1 Tax=Streptomyces cellulosae TaxID=1968 RepID=A0ABW7Y9N6_STRCE